MKYFVSMKNIKRLLYYLNVYGHKLVRVGVFKSRFIVCETQKMCDIFRI